VVEAAQRVTDVVQQSADHVLVVTTVPQGTRGGLQAVGVAVHRKAAVVPVEQLQVGHHAVGQRLRELHELSSDQLQSSWVLSCMRMNWARSFMGAPASKNASVQA